MIIQPIGSIYTDEYYALRSFSPYRRDPPVQIIPAENKPAVIDVVELSAEAQALLTASTKNTNQLIT